MPDKIEKNLLTLLHRFEGRMPSDFIRETVSLINDREWGIALENLCVQIYEYGILPSDQELNEIKRLSSQMKMKKDTWVFLAGNL